MFKNYKEIKSLKKTKLQMEVVLLGYLYSFMSEKEEYIECFKKILGCVKDIDNAEEIKNAVIHELATIIHETNKNKSKEDEQ